MFEAMARYYCIAALAKTIGPLLFQYLALASTDKDPRELRRKKKQRDPNRIIFCSAAESLSRPTQSLGLVCVAERYSSTVMWF